MPRPRAHFWLLVGAIAGLIVGAVGSAWTPAAASSPPRALRLGLSWLLGLLVFWGCAALYFRSNWAVAVDALRHGETLRRKAAERLEASVLDGQRWTVTLRDNLEEVHADSLPSRQRLYLDGARAHADKLVEVFERCAAVSDRLRDCQGEQRPK